MRSADRARADGYVLSPAGWICFSTEDSRLTALAFAEEGPKEGQRPFPPKTSGEIALHREISRQLEQYFQGTRQTYSIPLLAEGTEFQKKVWRALLDIPYGETRTYQEIARAIGNPNASRAVGMANHRNPIAILIPCHRVIGADGSLTGYAAGVWRKAYLLDLEKKYKACTPMQEWYR